MTDTTPALTSTIPLPSGASIPMLGFGTWQLTGTAASDAVAAALEIGYRHLDTATLYENENEVGAALRDSPVPREQVFVTSKLPPDQVGRERTTLEQSLTALGVDQLDLWLVHWPPDADKGLDVWQAFLRARDDGLVRDVGVSNYSLAQLDELTAATGVTPAVNQISWSPFRFDSALLAGHRERGVVVEGYSGLKRGTMEHPVVTGIAERIGRSPAQVLLRWQFEHGVIAIPKSASADRIKANAELDDVPLTPDDMAALDALSER